MRISTVAQTLEQQQAALSGAGVSKTFSDTMSGARDDRPGLAELMAYVREGDTVVVWKLDRLSRSLKDLLFLMERIAMAGAAFQSLTERIDTATAGGGW
jgi:DNA invertase Pin-like site-specific DNA recombinase